MKRLLLIFAALLAIAAPRALAAGHDGDEGESRIDPKEIIFEHLGDGYGWEVPFDHHHRIPLPCIVWGSDGLHVFSSARITGGETYRDGNVEFRLGGKDSEYRGKIVEILPDGREERPFDLSITKNVCALFISVIAVVAMMMALVPPARASVSSSSSSTSSTAPSSRALSARTPPASPPTCSPYSSSSSR